MCRYALPLRHIIILKGNLAPAGAGIKKHVIVARTNETCDMCSLKFYGKSAHNLDAYFAVLKFSGKAPHVFVGPAKVPYMFAERVYRHTFACVTACAYLHVHF